MLLELRFVDVCADAPRHSLFERTDSRRRSWGRVKAGVPRRRARITRCRIKVSQRTWRSSMLRSRGRCRRLQTTVARWKRRMADGVRLTLFWLRLQGLRLNNLARSCAHAPMPVAVVRPRLGQSLDAGPAGIRSLPPSLRQRLQAASPPGARLDAFRVSSPGFQLLHDPAQHYASGDCMNLHY